MPIYNGIEFIVDSVPSVIGQTYGDWNLIIGINGHPPMSIQYLIAKQYEYDSRIRVIDLEGIRGKSNALNEMMKDVNSDYVAILDVDDIWHPEKLKKQMSLVPQYDVIGTNCVYFGESDAVPKLPLGDLSNFDFNKFNPIINSSVIIRKEMCWWNTKWDGIEDYELWLRLRKLGKSFFNVSEILVKHRIHRQSAFNTKDHQLQIEEIKKLHA
jgi:glycosyltransferase involved in cell wall biosynthesis